MVTSCPYIYRGAEHAVAHPLYYRCALRQGDRGFKAELMDLVGHVVKVNLIEHAHLMVVGQLAYIFFEEAVALLI